jgi:hypothetical protein
LAGGSSAWCRSLICRQVALGQAQSDLVENALRQELTRIVERGAKAPYRHEVQIYSDEMVLLDRLVPFVAAALKRGYGAIVVATQSHRDTLALRLRSEGLDMDAAMRSGIYVAMDAASTLSIFMVDGMPNSTRFLNVVGGLIEEIAKAGGIMHRRVAVFGEWVSLLWNEGNVDAAIRLEQLGNQLVIKHEIDILCGYEMSSTCTAEGNQHFNSICVEHSGVYFQGR